MFGIKYTWGDILLCNFKLIFINQQNICNLKKLKSSHQGYISYSWGYKNKTRCRSQIFVQAWLLAFEVSLDQNFCIVEHTFIFTLLMFLITQRQTYWYNLVRLWQNLPWIKGHESRVQKRVQPSSRTPKPYSLQHGKLSKPQPNLNTTVGFYMKMTLHNHHPPSTHHWN